MSFKAVYICDFCCVEEPAVWTGLPNWDIPEGWFEGVDSVNGTEFHACDKCRDTL